MENAEQFKLEAAVDDYLQLLQEQGNYTSEDILELKNHLTDNVSELKEKSLATDEAFIIAKKRLGKANELSIEYKKVNGSKFYNRELFIIAFSISAYLLFYWFFTFVTGFIQQFAVFENKNLSVWGTINYVFVIIFTIVVVHLVFNSKKYIHSVEKLFIKSPTNFSITIITSIALMYALNLRVGRMFFKSDFFSSEEIQVRYSAFEIDHTLRAYIYSGLAGIWIVCILIALMKSYKKINFLETIINDSAYAPLFFVGFFWNCVAASTRMLHNFFISSYAFAIIWLIGILVFNIHLRRNILARNMVFISFGFLLELGAGIWMNPSLKAGAPVSVYFIALVIGSIAGFAIAYFIKCTRIAV